MNLRANPYLESVSEQSMVEIHPYILLDVLAQATSEEILVKDWSLFGILPHSGTKAPTQRSRSILGRIDLDCLGREIQ
ncbi:hypothetical protein ACOSQ2_013520 [Xanthoceras sorbifolium]